MKGFEGGCLCGAVRYRSDAAPTVTGNCYCFDCRRSSGTGHCSHLAVPSSAFAATGKVSVYDRSADSGNIVSRAFCPACGAPVYSTNSAMPQLVFIRASSLNDPEVFVPRMSVYVDRAPSWDAPAGGLPSFVEMPPAPPG